MIESKTSLNCSAGTFKSAKNEEREQKTELLEKNQPTTQTHRIVVTRNTRILVKRKPSAREMDCIRLINYTVSDTFLE